MLVEQNAGDDAERRDRAADHSGEARQTSRRAISANADRKREIRDPSGRRPR